MPLVSEQDLDSFAKLPPDLFFSSEKSFFWRARTSSGRGILHAIVAAESYGRIEDPRDIQSRIRFAVSMGADPDLRAEESLETPLHWAVFNTSVSCVKALVSAGASPFAINGAGATPLGFLREIRSIVRRRSQFEEKNDEMEAVLISAEESFLLGLDNRGEGGGDGSASI